MLATGEVGTVTQACANITGTASYRVRVDTDEHTLFRAAMEPDLEPA